MNSPDTYAEDRREIEAKSREGCLGCMLVAALVAAAVFAVGWGLVRGWVG